MDNRLEQALRLAELGFWIFPLKAKGKKPVHKSEPEKGKLGWQELATRNPDTIKAWFTSHAWNVGIFTSRFGDSNALLVIDVDNKGEKKGDEQLLRLELEGRDIPPTFTQHTPTGGRHLVYVVDEPVKQGANVFAPGLDARSRGGYIVGAGSVLADGAYSADYHPLARAPQWAIDVCGRAVERAPSADVDLSRVDPGRANRRAREYLGSLDVVTEGGRNDAAYRTACRVKDYGVTEAENLALMHEHWKCEPPLDDDELAHVVHSAYAYGTEAPGAAAPEAQFPPVQETEASTERGHPIIELNKEYAFIIAGGSGNILWETTDADGKFAFHLLNKQTFCDKLASRKIQYGDKPVPLTTAWMNSPDRRSYDGLVFEPGRQMPARWYNMWRGFTVKPAEAANHWALDMWLEHARVNVCGGDEALFKWLITWFAHLVQRPYEKPLVAIVFKGKKGTGKNALVERVGKLLGNHFLLTSRRRYVVGNFTMHLQHCLMFVLDEAFWSGDKEAEGIVKDLITGDKHDIEPKGKESYKVRNLTRVVVIGNEEWVVPASADERRWAVFNIGTGRQQDRAYFEKMRVGLDQQGGGAHLLRFLMDWPLDTADVNNAPKTHGLFEQKIQSLEPFDAWWYECLVEGRVICSDFGDEWPEFIEGERLRGAYARYHRERNIRSRALDARSIGSTLRNKLCPSIRKDKKRVGSATVNGYYPPLLDVARADFEDYIGHTGVWE